MKRFRLCFTLGAMLLLCVAPRFGLAQPSVSGTLTGSLGPGSYIVDGNCEVPHGSSLTIAPGTTFLHSGHYIWTISGRLQAVGTESDSIKFLGRWGGLRFAEGSSSESEAAYCVLDHGSSMSNPNAYGGCIHVDRVGIVIRNSSITFGMADESGGGIYATYADSILIDRCYVAHCVAAKGGGIYLSNCNGARVSNCVVENNYAEET